MHDFIGFVMRGSWGGAIFTALIFTSYFGAYYGPLLVLNPLMLPYFVIPGGVVGLILWFWTGQVDYPLGVILRVTTGIAVLFVLIVFFVIYHLTTDRFTQTDSSVTNVLEAVVRMSIQAIGIGGLAGLACPSKRLFTKAPRLSYRERVLLYEEAESQARKNRNP